MLELSQQQWAELQAADERNFIRLIRADIVQERPELANDPTLLERLNAAYEEALNIGMTNDYHIVQFLHLESRGPRFYRQPAVAAWLRKKGEPPEQRFDMMMDVARARLREKKGGQ